QLSGAVILCQAGLRDHHCAAGLSHWPSEILSEEVAVRRTGAMAEIVDLINFEASQLWDFMARLSQEGWSRPSACAGWTVGDVFAHVTQGARNWSATITRAMAGDANPPAGEQPLRPGERGSEVTAQRAIAFRQGMAEAELLNAF